MDDLLVVFVAFDLVHFLVLQLPHSEVDETVLEDILSRAECRLVEQTHVCVM